MTKMAIATVTMPTLKAMATTVPDKVSLSLRSRQTGFPDVSVWQITPGAQVGVDVTIAPQPSLLYLLFVAVYEHTVVVYVVVT